MTDYEDTLPITWNTRQRASSKQEAVEALAHLWVDAPEIFNPHTCDTTSASTLMDTARLYAKEWSIPFSPTLLKAISAQVLSDEDSWEASES